MNRPTTAAGALLARLPVIYQENYAYGNLAAGTTDGTLLMGDGTGKTLVATAGFKLVVIDYKLMVGATQTDVTFNTKKGAAAGVAISMLHACAVNGGIAAGLDMFGHFATKPSEQLTVTIGAGATAGVQLTYFLVPA